MGMKTGREAKSGAIFSFPELIQTEEQFEILGMFNDRGLCNILSS